MSLRELSLLAVLIVSLVVPREAPPGPGPSIPLADVTAGTYAVDPGHSSAFFRVKHLDIAHFYGRFNSMAGEFHIDPESPEDSSIVLVIDPNSVDTNSDGRDRHIKNEDFLHVEEHSEMTFRSTGVRARDGGGLDVTGELTLRGVTRTIEVPVDIVGAGETPFGPRVGVEATFSVDRFDYGMEGVPGGVGREIRFTISLEGVLQAG